MELWSFLRGHKEPEFPVCKDKEKYCKVTKKKKKALKSGCNCNVAMENKVDVKNNVEAAACKQHRITAQCGKPIIMSTTRGHLPATFDAWCFCSWVKDIFF